MDRPFAVGDAIVLLADAKLPAARLFAVVGEMPGQSLVLGVVSGEGGGVAGHALPFELEGSHPLPPDSVWAVVTLADDGYRLSYIGVEAEVIADAAALTAAFQDLHQRVRLEHVGLVATGGRSVGDLAVALDALAAGGAKWAWIRLPGVTDKWEPKR